jgi:hypothetical protein
MRRAVWKYSVPILDRFTIEMPHGAWLLHVGMHNGRPCLWAIVTPDAPPVARSFRLAGTGHPIGEESLSYLGSFLMDRDEVIFHLFEVFE